MTIPLNSVSGFLWDQGEYTRIDVPDSVPAATVSIGINNDTEVVGAYTRQRRTGRGARGSGARIAAWTPASAEVTASPPPRSSFAAAPTRSTSPSSPTGS